jgi:hypothetical protein
MNTTGASSEQQPIILAGLPVDFGCSLGRGPVLVSSVKLFFTSFGSVGLLIV